MPDSAATLWVTLTRCLCAMAATVVLALIWTPSARAQADKVGPDRVVPYITLRDRTGSRTVADFYGQERSDMKSGRCGVNELGLDLLSSAAEIAPFRIPEEILRVVRIEEMPRDRLWADLRASAANRPPTLYVHGFFIDFEKGCRRASVLARNAGLEGAMMWFSWPSDGNLLNYARDEVDLYWSVPDLAAVIVEMEREFGRGEVNLVAHSLGARGLMLALYHLANAQSQVRVDNVVLLAPDIDFEISVKLLPYIRDLANRITVYTAPSDRPLTLSEQLHGYPRLGQSGNDVSRLTGVETIDLGALPNSSPTGYLYHLYSEEVGADLNRLLTESAGAAERENLSRMGDTLWRILPFD